MRTTLVIDDDILRVAKAQAASTGRSIGLIISELARKGLTAEIVGHEEGFPVFHVSERAPVFGPEDVARGEDGL